MKKGDRVRYVGRREKYRDRAGVVERANFSGGALAGMVTIRFDAVGNNGTEVGVFTDQSDFITQPAVDDLGDLVRDEER